MYCKQFILSSKIRQKEVSVWCEVQETKRKKKQQTDRTNVLTKSQDKKTASLSVILLVISMLTFTVAIVLLFGFSSRFLNLVFF